MKDIVYRIKNLKKHIAEAEVLLDSIIVKEQATVYPTNCPGKGRQQDVQFDGEERPACVLDGQLCKYFNGSIFRLTDYTKKINCAVI